MYLTVADQVSVVTEGKGHMSAIKCLFNNTLPSKRNLLQEACDRSLLELSFLSHMNGQEILFFPNTIQNPLLVPEDASSMWAVPSQNQVEKHACLLGGDISGRFMKH